MRKIIWWVVASVDGYVDGPKGEFDWAATPNEDFNEYSNRLHERADTLLFGRGVWDMMSSYWPNVESISDSEHDKEFAKYWLDIPKVVFSRTLEKADWGTQVIGDNLSEEVTALKQQPGKDMLLSGGSRLPAALTALGLIDEYHIAVHPVVLGGGNPLFREPERRVDLELVGTRTLGSTAVVLHYQPADSTPSE